MSDRRPKWTLLPLVAARSANDNSPETGIGTKILLVGVDHASHEMS